MRLPDRARLRAVPHRWWVMCLVVLVAGTAGGWTWLSRDSGSVTQRITATVARGTFKTTVSATGTITPRRDQDLTFSSSGTVSRVPVSVGDRVRRGDVLAALDPTALQAQLTAAKAQLTAARAQVAGDGAATAQQRASDAASLAAAESDLGTAEDALGAATIRAPFSGTVSAVGYSVGDQVGSGSNAPAAATGAGTTAAITLISPHSLEVDANVSAADVGTLRKGMQAVITPTGGGEVAYGTVSEIGVIATASDSGAAQFPVTVDITGPTTGLYAGSTAGLAITVKQASDVLAVATQALHTSGAQTFVYVVDGTARRKQVVTIGETYGMQTQVLSGLQAGDVVELVSFTRTGNTNRTGGTNGFRPPEGGFGGAPSGVPGGVPGGAPGGGQGPVLIQNGG